MIDGRMRRTLRIPKPEQLNPLRIQIHGDEAGSSLKLERAGAST
jgi:hypothetical protein